MESQRGFRAGGDIRPARFVKSTTADNEVQECNANEESIGVTKNTQKEFDNTDHADDGDVVHLQSGKDVEVEFGGAVVIGVRVKSDADGKAVTVGTTTSENQETCGVALQTGADGKFSWIRWDPKVVRPLETNTT